MIRPETIIGKRPRVGPPRPAASLDSFDGPLHPLQESVTALKALQRSDGYWWFSLEANESIGAEFILLMHYLGEVDEDIQRGICRRILDVQRPDGTWAIYHDGPACLSTTVECYFALKLSGMSPEGPEMQRARAFILKNGGIEKTRVFTKIHLAMFGIVPWQAAPAMPAEYIFLPTWTGCSIYEFSSWARATIVPLLVFISLKQTRVLPGFPGLEELFCSPPSQRKYHFKTKKSFVSWEYFFILFDKCMKFFEWIPFKPIRKKAVRRCLSWTWEHLSKTEDIYPAMAYAALAFKAAGYRNDSPEIRKPFEALKMFQQYYPTLDVPPLPDEIRDDGRMTPSQMRELGISPFVTFSRPAEEGFGIHQQCCISPVWDTPWVLMALLEAGVRPDDPALLRAGRWLIRKQITHFRGDWAVKNRGGPPGGWAFEFENDAFPDVDDTIEVLQVLDRLVLPWEEKARACGLGLDWLLSMQNDDGGWGAFDKNQQFEVVNRIPFSDHGACLDPSSPDIAGRMLELLAGRRFSREHLAVERALDYLWRTQEEFGGWWARWGICYLYGTWCALTGLAAFGFNEQIDPRAACAVAWLESVQHSDGGFGESPESYREWGTYVDASLSLPSQTAWGLMALVAGGAASRPSARRAAKWLFNARNEGASWDERHYTGTGFPNHFYIRYHGYRHYFPLLALGRYLRAVPTSEKS